MLTLAPLRPLLLVLAAALAAAFLAPERAAALSCVGEEDVLVGAEAAFLGELVAQDGDRLTFRVQRSFRRKLGGRVVVRDEMAGTSFPLGVRVGEEVGLTVRTVAGELVTGPCSRVNPDRLRAAAREGWPQGVIRFGPRAAVGRAGVRAELRCQGRCTGTLSLRGDDRRTLGRGRLSVDAGRSRVVVRLNRLGQRRVAGGRRVAATAQVVLRGGGSARVRLSLIGGRGG